MLGQLLLEGFAVNSSILQNSYKFFFVYWFKAPLSYITHFFCVSDYGGEIENDANLNSTNDIDDISDTSSLLSGNKPDFIFVNT